MSVQLVASRSMRGIALEGAHLIRNGALRIGVPLPPARELAEAFCISPADIPGAHDMWMCADYPSMPAGATRTSLIRAIPNA